MLPVMNSWFPTVFDEFINSDNPEVEAMRAAFLMKQRALSERKAEEIGANGVAMDRLQR